jgi:hypothetical protein
MAWPKRKAQTARTSNAVGLVHGFRSGLEDTVATQIKVATGSPAAYEQEKIEYLKPARKAKYTPDFRLKNGIFVETKGRFTADDRQKHRLIKEQHPSLDIRFVFQNSRARITKNSNTTYADWCQKYGFQYADKLIPADWFRE